MMIYNLNFLLCCPSHCEGPDSGLTHLISPGELSHHILVLCRSPVWTGYAVYFNLFGWITDIACLAFKCI